MTCLFLIEALTKFYLKQFLPNFTKTHSVANFSAPRGKMCPIRLLFYEENINVAEIYERVRVAGKRSRVGICGRFN